MKIAALLILVAVASPRPAFADDCTFDQKGIASELHRIASLNPGFKPVAGEPAVEWQEASGATIRVSYGGCVDLGVEVAIRVPSHSHPSTEAILDAVERYWSASAAHAVRDKLKAGRAVRSSEAGSIVLDLAPSDDFPFGATIRLDARQASISWTVA